MTAVAEELSSSQCLGAIVIIRGLGKLLGPDGHLKQFPIPLIVHDLFKLGAHGMIAHNVGHHKFYFVLLCQVNQIQAFLLIDCHGLFHQYMLFVADKITANGEMLLVGHCQQHCVHPVKELPVIRADKIAAHSLCHMLRPLQNQVAAAHNLHLAFKLCKGLLVNSGDKPASNHS